jgi:ParB/RepB/Spo0J family partition protein
MSMNESSSSEVESKVKPQVSEDSPRELDKVIMVPTDKISIPRERVTAVFDAGLEEEFFESVKSKGILTPVTLLDVEGELWLIDGLHRIQAAERLKISQVPALVHKGTIDDLLIENLISIRQRGKSNPAQEADVLAYLVQKRNYPVETAAKNMGLSLDWARKLIKISTLPEEIKDLIKNGKIPVTGAFYLPDLPTPQDMVNVAQDAAFYGYTAYQIKSRVGTVLNPDVEPEQGDYKFTQNGTPQRIPIRCRFCGAELPDTGKQYIWVCAGCEKDAADLLKDYRQALKQQTQTEAQPSAKNP